MTQGLNMQSLNMRDQDTTEAAVVSVWTRS